ncbi:MAG TPA: LapA family protein, partial [Usitatibacter sp.]|nr:LapA family protein [Usitatibacter sp.]
FAAGIVIGLLAWVPTVVRQRRDIGRLRKTAARLAAIQPPPAAAAPEPPPPVVEASERTVRGDAHGI